MICPEGYTLAKEIWRVATDHAIRAVPNESDSAGGIAQNLDRDELYERMMVREVTRISVMTVWCRSPEHQPHIFDGARQLLKIDIEAIYSLLSGPLRLKKDTDRLTLERRGPFVFIDPKFWTIDVADYEKCIDISEWSEEERADLAAHARALVPFQGWSICYKSVLVPTNIDELRAFLRSQLPEFTRQKWGRPSVQNAVIECYVRLFPDGHVGRTWKEVRREIAAAGGPMASEDTLRRALKTPEPQKPPQNE